MSVGAFNERLRILKRGGARPRAERVSYRLTDKQCRDLIAAIAVSGNINVPLNRFITIHWEKAGLVGKDAAGATAQYLKYVRDWLYKQGLPFAYVWIRENDYGDGSKGDHVHILAHVPAHCSVGHLQRRWLRAITGNAYIKGTIFTRTIGGHLEASTVSPEHYHINLIAVARYALKGGSKGISEALGLGRWDDGGRVIGTRTGMSKNLSRAVRDGIVSL